MKESMKKKDGTCEREIDERMTINNLENKINKSLLLAFD